jgi:hypothetical protein
VTILVDTDIMIDLLRQRPAATVWMSTHQQDRLATSGYAAMEIIQGTQHATDLRAADRLLKQIQIVWPSPGAHVRALAMFRQVHLANAIGILDMLIAHTAIDMNLPLHTFNLKHYAAVPGLQTIQPYAR